MESLVQQPIVPTRSAREIIEFMGMTEEELRTQFERSGLLDDPNSYAARELENGSVTFVAYRNGVSQIRLFVGSEWLNDMEISKIRHQLSWG